MLAVLKQFLSHYTVAMGVSKGAGANDPLEFENDDVICCSPVKYPKFSLAPSALAFIRPKRSIKCKKNFEIFHFSVAGARKIDDFCYVEFEIPLIYP